MIDGIANTGAHTYVGEKQNFSYRHTSTCALTFHASLFVSSICWLDVE
jgi:hypothetical protein